ncbi:hypothetical protein [Butyricimonas paravirosa]|uniref:hypothetical protein n=1 Tax=Butyricimonas paravirosa TaxID=1472417 RepID=UPI00351FA634
MKIVNTILAILLSVFGMVSLIAGLSGITHQYMMFGISLIVVIPMWDEIYKEYKRYKNINRKC